jgi:hypothetical protein
MAGMADHPHTIDRWDDATGENLMEQIAQSLGVMGEINTSKSPSGETQNNPTSVMAGGIGNESARAERCAAGRCAASCTRAAERCAAGRCAASCTRAAERCAAGRCAASCTRAASTCCPSSAAGAALC